MTENEPTPYALLMERAALGDVNAIKELNAGGWWNINVKDPGAVALFVSNAKAWGHLPKPDARFYLRTWTALGGYAVFAENVPALHVPEMLAESHYREAHRDDYVY